MTTTPVTTKVVTGKVRLSYTYLFEPRAGTNDDGSEKKPQYQTAIIIPKADTATLTKIRNAVEAARQAGAAKWKGKVLTADQLKMPLRDGDLQRPDDEAFKDSYFINCNSGTQPGIVDKDLNPILDKTAVYSGCYARVQINFYPFANKSNGIAAGLDNVQKLADGEPLAGRDRAEDVFAKEEAADFLN